MTVRIRPATPADAPALLTLRNDPLVRAWAGQPHETTSDAHARWVAGMLARSESCLLVAEDADTGHVVGYGAFSLTTIAIGAGIGVAPESREEGVGGQILSALMDEARARGADTYGGVIHPANQPSWRMFLKAGFVLASRMPTLVKSLT